MVQFKSKVNQDVFLQIFIVQRQSKLDEVTGRTGEADGLGGIPATQPPLTTPLEKRDISPQLSILWSTLLASWMCSHRLVAEKKL